jgi:hypothetical protein
MSRPIIFLLLAMGCTLNTVAQDSTVYVESQKVKKDTRPLKDRLWFGGGLGLNFGNVTSIQIEPLVGYKVDKNGKFSVGTGLTYWYLSDNRFTPKVEQNAYGYRLFSRYRFIPQAFAHTEFLNLNAERFIGATSDVQRIWVPHLLVGGGYAQPISGSSVFTLQVLWEVLQDPNSVYRGQGPIISGGLGFGF